MALNGYTFRQVGWVDAVRGAQLSGDRELRGVQVNGEDTLGFTMLRSLNNCQADGTQTKDCHRRAFFNVTGFPRRTKTSTKMQVDVRILRVNGNYLNQLTYRAYLTPQPNKHTFSKGESGWIFAQEISFTTVYSA